jgi:hypothetical protein
MSVGWVKPNVVKAACRRWIPQESQILHGAGRMANLQFDTMASEY